MVHVSSFSRTSRASRTLPRPRACLGFFCELRLNWNLFFKPFLHQSPQFDFECMSALADGRLNLTELLLKEIGKLNEAGAYPLFITDLDAGRLALA